MPKDLKYELALSDDEQQQQQQKPSEALVDAVNVGITKLESSIIHASIKPLLDHISRVAQAQLGYAQQCSFEKTKADAVRLRSAGGIHEENAAPESTLHALVCAAINNWFELRGCFLDKNLCEALAAVLRITCEDLGNSSGTYDAATVEMVVGSEKYSATLQWFLTWFAYFASGIGPLNPTLRHVDLSADNVNPVLTWITPDVITYMAFLQRSTTLAAGHRFKHEGFAQDLTFSELLQYVNVLRDGKTEQGTDKTEESINKGMRTETMCIPVCLMRLGGYTLAQRLLSSGGLLKVSTNGDASEVMGSMVELFTTDNALIALPLMLMCEDTRQQCIRAISTTFGLLNAFLKDAEHAKDPDWFVKMLPVQVVTQCMPVIMDVVIGSVLEFETIQTKSAELAASRVKDMETRVAHRRMQGKIVVTRRVMDSFQHPVLEITNQKKLDANTQQLAKKLQDILITADLRQQACASSIKTIETYKRRLKTDSIGVANDPSIGLDINGVLIKGTYTECIEHLEQTIKIIRNRIRAIHRIRRETFWVLKAVMQEESVDVTKCYKLASTNQQRIDNLEPDATKQVLSIDETLSLTKISFPQDLVGCVPVGLDFMDGAVVKLVMLGGKNSALCHLLLSNDKEEEPENSKDLEESASVEKPQIRDGFEELRKFAGSNKSRFIPDP